MTLRDYQAVIAKCSLVGCLETALDRSSLLVSDKPIVKVVLSQARHQKKPIDEAIQRVAVRGTTVKVVKTFVLSV